MLTNQLVNMPASHVSRPGACRLTPWAWGSGLEARGMTFVRALERPGNKQQRQVPSPDPRAPSPEPEQ